ncbi:MAG TPA: WhiB family transcriptional regulator [Ilumatobacteraceae bacterium]
MTSLHQQIIESTAILPGELTLDWADADLERLLDDESTLVEPPVVRRREIARGIARCADGTAAFTYLFFSDDEFDIGRAKSICRKCARREECLAGARLRREPCGVWGGELFVDGEVVAVKRGRGRPPKQPRPPIEVDEVPVPPHLVA